MNFDKETAMLTHRLLARTRALGAVLELKGERVEGPVLTGIGAEGIGIGACMALLRRGILQESLLHGDQRTQYGFMVGKNEVFPEAHDHLYEILKNYALVQTGPNQGEDGNIHTGCLEHGVLPFATSDMGRMIAVLAGQIEALRYVRWPEIEDASNRPVAIGAFGEGAANQGCIHEAMNIVAASNCRLNDMEMIRYETFLDRIGKELRVMHGAPMIFVVNRNQFSIYTDEREEHGRSNIAARALGYGDMRGVTAKGWDVFDVMEKMTEAIDHAQRLRATLFDIETYRLTAHSRAMIARDVNNPRLDEGKIRGLSAEDLRRGWEFFDPLKNCRRSLVAWGYADEQELLAIEQEETKRADELFERAFTQEPEATLENRSKKTVMIPYAFMPCPKAAAQSGTKHMRYNEAFVEVSREILRNNPHAIMLGEDIHRGGVLGETMKGNYFLADEFGHRRVRPTPISEEGFTSFGAGWSLYRDCAAFVFYQFASFWRDAYVSWKSVVSVNFWQKNMRFNVKGIFPFGVVHGGGSGKDHEGCEEGPLMGMGGIVILFPGDAYDVAGLMRAAAEYPGPVAIFLQIHAFGNSEFSADVPEDHYVIPFGSARVRREGKDVSVFAYGAACVKAACNEAEFLSRLGVDVEVIDIRCLEPLDIDALYRSAVKIGRVIIMHEATWREGCGIHIKHQLDEALANEHMKTRKFIEILCAEDNPIPTKKNFLWQRLPFEWYVVKKGDEFGEPRTILRSSKLARLAKELKEVYR